MSDPTSRRPTSRWDSVDTTAYDRRWEQMARDGHNPHGEADFVQRFSPVTVLDAGCGTGRLAIELARRGCTATGVDLDGPMIAAAQAKAPDLAWHELDLATFALDQTFDVVVLAGNVMIFLAPDSEGAVLHRLACHMAPEGELIVGFQLDRNLSAEQYEHHAREAGLVMYERFSSWDAEPFTADSGYLVAVHRHRDA